MKWFTLQFFLLTILFGSSFAQTNCDTIEFNSNGHMITGYFYPSELINSQTLIFTQGFMETGDVWELGKTLSEKGINVFMFDFRGCFNSEGKQGLMNSQEDIGSAIAFLKSKEIIEKYKIDTSRIILGGYSYGGHMSMIYAIHHPDIKRVISISGGDLGIFAEIVESNTDYREGYTNFFKSIAKPKGPVEFQFDDPIEEVIRNKEYFSIINQAEKLKGVDILMTGGLDDGVVSMEKYLLPLYRSITKNKDQQIKFIVYQTNHSYRNYSHKLLDDIMNWINKE